MVIVPRDSDPHDPPATIGFVGPFELVRVRSCFDVRVQESVVDVDAFNA